MDYDARYVVASFDHVWTEVYSVSQRKWIHVDPSDNVIDAPLIYEHGWKRDVDYIIAYSRDDIQDVTWRYCSDYEQVCLNLQLGFTNTKTYLFLFLLGEIAARSK